ncbi:MAG TPA: hypothetical protein VHQ86_01990 [Candidatus Saccharimonadia bacterium]|jgi:hypothetical protein|nr:hypothetical protein [Candidatus Saccharimonadia bacterium]
MRCDLTSQLGTSRSVIVLHDKDFKFNKKHQRLCVCAGVFCFWQKQGKILSIEGFAMAAEHSHHDQQHERMFRPGEDDIPGALEEAAAQDQVGPAEADEERAIGRVSMQEVSELGGVGGQGLGRALDAHDRDRSQREGDMQGLLHNIRAFYDTHSAPSERIEYLEAMMTAAEKRGQHHEHANVPGHDGSERTMPLNAYLRNLLHQEQERFKLSGLEPPSVPEVPDLAERFTFLNKPDVIGGFRKQVSAYADAIDAAYKAHSNGDMTNAGYREELARVDEEYGALLAAMDPHQLADDKVQAGMANYTTAFERAIDVFDDSTEALIRGKELETLAQSLDTLYEAFWSHTIEASNARTAANKIHEDYQQLLPRIPDNIWDHKDFEQFRDRYTQAYNRVMRAVESDKAEE